MVDWHDSLQRQAWRPYIETSLLLETRLDEDLRTTAGMSLVDYTCCWFCRRAPRTGCGWANWRRAWCSPRAD